MRSAIFLALFLSLGLIHADEAVSPTAMAAPLTPVATAVAASISAGSLSDPTDAVLENDSLLMHEGNWWLSIQGGASYSYPYNDQAVAAAEQNPSVTYDLSADRSGYGGVSLGRALRQHWSVEVGGLLLEPRHYHENVQETILESNIERDLQTGFVFLQLSRHWSLGWQNTLSLGMQAGVGLLFETIHNQVPSQGVDSTELDSDIGAELSPLLRIDHYFDTWQSFGLEAGYRFFRFSKGSGYDNDPLNFSGVTVAVRWSTRLGRAALSPPAP